MAGPLTWIFELLDKVSAPAKTIAGSLGEIDIGFGKLSQDVAVGTLLADAIENAAEKVFELGKGLAELTLHAATFERQSTIAFKGLLGSGEAAEGALADVKHFANEAGLSFEKVQGLFSTGLLGGLKQTGPLKLIDVAQFGTDVEAITHGRRSAESIVQAFADIQSRGQLTSRSLMQFAGVIDFEALGRKLGFSVKNFQDLQHVLTSTPVGAEKGLLAIMKTFAEAGGRGGKVGGVSVEMGGELPGQIQKIKNQWEDLLGSFGKTTAFQGLLDLLGQVGKLFDPATESGKKMSDQLGVAFSRIGEGISEIKPGDLTGFVDTLITLGSAIGTVIDFFVRFAATVAFGWAQIISFGSHIGEFFGDVFRGFLFALKEIGFIILEKLRDLRTLLIDFGKFLLQGLVEGVLGSLHLLDDMTGNIGSKLIGGLKSVLGIHSPSEVMAELGEQTAAGFHEGLERADLARSVSVSVPDIRGSTSAGGHSLHVEQHNHYTINSGAGVDTEDLAQRLAKISLGDLQAAFDTFAQSMGAA